MKRITTSLIALLVAGAVQAHDASLSAMFFSKDTTVEEVAAAIADGADIHERSGLGQEPLHYAIRRGAPIEVIKYLIDQGAHVNQPTGKGLFVTYYAARFGDMEMLRVLKEAGADFTKRDYMEEDPAHWVALNDNVTMEMIDFLKAEGLDFSRPNRNAETPAMKTVWDIRQEFGVRNLKLLIEAGSDPYGINGQGRDMLMMSFLHGRGDHGATGMQHLFEMSEDPFAADNSGLSGILLATSFGLKEDSLLFLEKNGYDLKLKDAKGANAIVRAAYRGDDKAIDLLVDRGFDIHSTDNAGTTPLLNAMPRGKASGALRLIELGADINHANDKGQTPLMLALGRDFNKKSRHGHHGHRHGPTWDDVLDTMLEQGADLTAVDADGTTTLVYALQGNKSPDIIRQIIKAGVDVNQPDGIGTTPLMLAAMNGQDATVLEILLDAGADPSARDVFGDTAGVLLAENAALADSDLAVRMQ